MQPSTKTPLHPQFQALQPLDLVAQAGSLFKLKVRCCGSHPLLKVGQCRFEVMAGCASLWQGLRLAPALTLAFDVRSSIAIGPEKHALEVCRQGR